MRLNPLGLIRRHRRQAPHPFLTILGLRSFTPNPEMFSLPLQSLIGVPDAQRQNRLLGSNRREVPGPAFGPPYFLQKSFLMRTEKQIAASRLNGRKSSGATTSEGKARIVAANLKSGVYAESEILPREVVRVPLIGQEAEDMTTTAPSFPGRRHSSSSTTYPASDLRQFPLAKLIPNPLGIFSANLPMSMLKKSMFSYTQRMLVGQHRFLRWSAASSGRESRQK